MTDEVVKIVVRRGFVVGVGKMCAPGDILEYKKRDANGHIQASQALLATPENVKLVKDELDAAQAERDRLKAQDQRARDAFLALARPAAAAGGK